MKITNLPEAKSTGLLQAIELESKKIVEAKKELNALEARAEKIRSAPVSADSVIATYEVRLSESRAQFLKNIRNEIEKIAFGAKPAPDGVILGLVESGSPTTYGAEYEAMAAICHELIMKTVAPIAKEVCKGGSMSYETRNSELAEIGKKIEATHNLMQESACIIKRLADLPNWTPIFGVDR